VLAYSVPPKSMLLPQSIVIPAGPSLPSPIYL
jgi:hypothetical protein